MFRQATQEYKNEHKTIVQYKSLWVLASSRFTHTKASRFRIRFQVQHSVQKRTCFSEECEQGNVKSTLFLVQLRAELSDNNHSKWQVCHRYTQAEQTGENKQDRYLHRVQQAQVKGEDLPYCAGN